MKFLGVCLLLASAMLSGAIVYHAEATPRYQFVENSDDQLTWQMFDARDGKLLLRMMVDGLTEEERDEYVENRKLSDFLRNPPEDLKKEVQEIRERQGIGMPE